MKKKKQRSKTKQGRKLKLWRKRIPAMGCSSIFSFPLPLQLHIKNNHKGKLKCDECNYRANTVKVIEDHKKEFHSNMDVPLTETTGANKGMELVAKVFDFGRKEKRKPTELLTPKVKKAKRTGHLYNRVVEKIACAQCEGTFTRKDSLRRHIARAH